MINKQKSEMTIEEKDNKIIFNILFIICILLIGGFIYSIANKPQLMKAGVEKAFETNQQVKTN